MMIEKDSVRIIPVSGIPQSQDSTLKNKKDLHLLRKIWHCIGVLIIFALFNALDLVVGQILLAVFCITVVSFDIRRLASPKLNSYFQKIFGPVMRSREINQISGMSYLFAGALVLVLFFPAHIVNLALLFLAFADPIASFVGVKWGKDRLCENKTVQGFVAAFVVCTVISALYLIYFNLSVERLLIISPFAGLSGAIAESLPLKSLDDNFTLPCVSAVLVYLLFFVFGIL